MDFQSPEDAKSSSQLERSFLADFLTSFCNCFSTFQFPFYSSFTPLVQKVQGA